MAALEAVRNGAIVKGIIPNQSVEIVSVDWIGEQALNVVYRVPGGSVAETTLYRDDEFRLDVEEGGRAWSLDADGSLLRLVTEANRIKLAHYFDPYLAIHTSLVDPLPHQITAVYGEMLPRQPLRFLLADDPGAGKTIMAGLLIKELIARSDLERCLIVAPGSLVEQWQDELGQKFGLEFDILSRDMIETSRSGNAFNDHNRLITRLDVLARNEDLQQKLISSNEWDLIICDEAHRMSATYFGGDVKFTKRYQLGQNLGRICRHLLLMSATPHNGKEEDFQLFMALLDGDRGRDAVHRIHLGPAGRLHDGARIGIQGFEVTPLPFVEQDVKGQRRFAGTGNTGHHTELAARNIYRQRLEVVFLGVDDTDGVRRVSEQRLGGGWACARGRFANREASR